jgi:predicted DNA-binding transcriptional regulator YafY
MYSPTTRLLTVLELLQSYKRMSGAEIARRLEVDSRTVRRYIVMLQDMGIPVEAERGPYGSYQLQRGYRLPPLMFTDTEAIALTLGLLAIRIYRFPVDVAAVEGALAKTERVMPEKLLNQARALQEAISFNVVPSSLQVDSEDVVLLSSAVRERQRVHLSYEAWGGKATERDFDPYGIVFHDGYWYTSGYCHLRNDLRTFRLDRIVALEARKGTFERPDSFDALTHVLQSLVTMPGTDQVDVLLRTTFEQAQREVSPGMATLEETGDGVIFRRAATQLEWVAGFLMMRTYPVEVRGPQSLRDMVRKMGARAYTMIGEESPSA